MAARDPVAPLNIPVPPVMVQGKLSGVLMKLDASENDAMKLSFALNTNVNAP